MLRIHSDPVWNIHPHLLAFIQHNSLFMAGISRQIRKCCTRDISTACVMYNIKTRELVLYYNDLFMASLTNAKVHGVLKHEFCHIAFRHVTARVRKPAGDWNIACDMAIDWLVWHEAELEADVGPGRLDPAHDPLPAFAKTPGRFPGLFCAKTYRERPVHQNEHAAQAIPMRREGRGFVEDFDAPADLFKTREPTALEMSLYQYAKLIADAPGNMASEWYFQYLLAHKKPGGDGGERDGNCGPPGSGGEPSGDESPIMLPMDDHEPWDSLPDDLRDKIENDIRAIVQRAVRDADSHSSGWGHMPKEISDLIRKSVSTSLDWKALLHHFVGTANRGETRRSITVRDRKYGLLQPGIITGHIARIVIVIDQSASVNDEMLATFFAELSVCTQKISVTIIPFDTECKIEDMWEWTKGETPELKRVRCGGTNFNAPTELINKHAGEYGWEAAIFMTDGECFKPNPCSIRRGWVLGAGCSIPDWMEQEFAISMDDSFPEAGTWR